MVPGIRFKLEFAQGIKTCLEAGIRRSWYFCPFDIPSCEHLLARIQRDFQIPPSDSSALALFLEGHTLPGFLSATALLKEDCTVIVKQIGAAG